MDRADTYTKYVNLALQLDRIQKKDAWKRNKVSSLYDWERIESRLANMQELRRAHDINGLIHCLRQDLMKNLGGICNPTLYNISNVGTKVLIEQYHNEVIKCVQYIYYYQGSKLNLQRKLEFFAETRHSYGRTALFLSGGASFGKFHFGVCKALYEHDLFPRVIAGSSVGSLIAACICTHSYSDLWKIFREDYQAMTAHILEPKFSSVFDALKKLKEGEPLLSTEVLKQACYRFTKDITFLEIFEKYKWNLNVTVTDGIRQGDSKLLNYLTAPNVVVWSAVVASCSIPGVFQSVELMIKTEDGKLKPYYMSRLRGNFKFIDGSVACDLPLSRMSELFNINTYIVSQVNPHASLFVTSDGQLSSQSRLRRNITKLARNLLGNEIRHLINQMYTLGIIPSYIKGIVDLVMQSYRGHVTISPNPSLRDYRKLIDDVDSEGFDQHMQNTYIQTVQRIDHIRALYGIEREFDRYYLRLKQKLNSEINLKNDKDLIKYSINQMLVRNYCQ